MELILLVPYEVEKYFKMFTKVVLRTNIIEDGGIDIDRKANFILDALSKDKYDKNPIIEWMMTTSVMSGNINL